MDLLLLGCLFLVGLAADVIGRITPLPRVSILLLSGVLIGPSAIGMIPAEVAQNWFPILTQVALGMIGFLMGQELTIDKLREHGKSVLAMSLSKALFAAVAVFIACIAVGMPFALAAVLAGIATATAPAATYDVLHESGATGPYAKMLLSIVALDDVWGLIIFSLLIAFASTGGADLSSLMAGTSEVVGSIALGIALGVPMAYITGRISFGTRPGEPILAEALGFIFVAAGCAAILELSAILTTISMGAVVAQLATHHSKTFNAIEGVEWPFMILFFIMAGASLEINAMTDALGFVALYLAARAIGTLAGAYLGGRTTGLSAFTSRWIGFGLFPQAGVALGMALIAAQKFPEHGQLILTIVLSSTVILEVFSPPLTRYALGRLEKNQ